MCSRTEVRMGRSWIASYFQHVHFLHAYRNCVLNLTPQRPSTAGQRGSEHDTLGALQAVADHQDLSCCQPCSETVSPLAHLSSRAAIWMVRQMMSPTFPTTISV